MNMMIVKCPGFSGLAWDARSHAVDSKIMRRWSSDGLMLGHRRRRWPIIKPTPTPTRCHLNAVKTLCQRCTTNYKDWFSRAIRANVNTSCNTKRRQCSRRSSFPLMPSSCLLQAGPLHPALWKLTGIRTQCCWRALRFLFLSPPQFLSAVINLGAVFISARNS